MSSNNIIVTNDDGIQSPFLAPLISNIKEQFSANLLSFTVPDEERSWISQAISRRAPIEVSKLDIGGVSGYKTTGFPADCVNLAIDNLYEDQPDLVVSGINIGVNAGLPYYLYSGTVAAARAAFLRGVRAIALSLSVPPEIYSLWRGKDQEGFQVHAKKFNQISKVAAEICLKLSQDKFWSDVDYFSVNLPWETNSNTEIGFYEMDCFRLKTVFSAQSDGTYVHDFQGLESLGENASGDLTAVQSGKIAITPIKYSPNSLCPDPLLTTLKTNW